MKSEENKTEKTNQKVREMRDTRRGEREREAADLS